MRTRRRNRSRRRSRRGGGPSFFSRFFGTSSAPAAPIPDHPDELMIRKQKGDAFEPLILPIDMASRSYKEISNSCVEGTTLTFQEVLTKLRERADESAISDINHPLDCSKNVVPIDLLVKRSGRYLVPGFDIKEGNIIFDFKKEYTDLQSFITAIGAIAPPPLAPPPALLPQQEGDELFSFLGNDRDEVPLPDGRLTSRISGQDRSGRSQSVPRSNPLTVRPAPRPLVASPQGPGGPALRPPQGPPGTGGPALRPPQGPGGPALRPPQGPPGTGGPALHPRNLQPGQVRPAPPRKTQFHEVGTSM